MRNMDKHERRRLRLKQVLEGEFGGKKSALARLLDKDASYVTRMLYPEGKPGKKGIGEDSVELIKRVLGVDLDEDPGATTATTTAPNERRLQWVDAHEAELLSSFRSTDDQGRQTMLESGREVPKVLFDELALHKAKNGAA